MLQPLTILAAAIIAWASIAPQRTDAQVSAPAQPAIDVSPVVIARGLRHPWSIAFLPGGELLVTEKDGSLVRVATDGRLIPISGLPDDLDNTRLDPRDNSGLFDIALHPRFAANRLLFLTYSSRGEGGTAMRLVRARLDGDRLTRVEQLFEATPRSPDRFHYGGALLVAGRHLYLTTGERHYNEQDNPPLPAAQDPGDRRGKIYRFTLDGRLAPARRGVNFFASGIRASQGMAQDAESGTIWFTDHGSVGGDELNRLEAGANYGWPVLTTGTYRNRDYRPGRTLTDARYTDPAYSWGARVVAPTGLAVHTGSVIPEWHGDLIVGGLSRGNLMRVDIEDGVVLGVDYLMTDQPVRIRNVRQAPNGALYAVTDEREGRVLRLDRKVR